MDLGLLDRRALVAASTQGLGYACAQSLAQEGAIVAVNGRTSRRVQEARARLMDEVPGARVIAAPGDITTPDGRTAVLEAAPDVDVLVTNNAGPPLGGLDTWNPDSLHDAVALNAVPAVEFMRHYVPGMRKRGFGRVVHITSAMVAHPTYELGVSAASRSALTALSRSLSREVASDGVTVNTLMPGRIATERQKAIVSRRMVEESLTQEEAERRSLAAIPVGRFGTPKEVGDLCAFLCSQSAGYLTGQNILLDGGTYGGPS